MNDLPRFPLVEGATRVPATGDDLADAITCLVGRYSNELAASGMSAAEAGATAVELVAEAVRPSTPG